MEPGRARLFLFEKGPDMTPKTEDKPRMRLLQVDVPFDLVTQIDRLAREELISRSDWVRRLIHSTIRNANCGAR